MNLQAIDQLYNNCFWRFQNWQKIQNGTVVQTFNTRNITITPTANTTYKANFTSENSFNFVKTGPLKGLYHGESRVFTMYPQYGNPPANYSWQVKFRYIVNGQEEWSNVFPEGCSINFYTNGGNSATLTNIHFSTYCSGWWADSVMRVYGFAYSSNCGSPGQQFFEEITLKNRQRPGSPPPPPPPGGCPYVYTWNGSDWIEDNNILPQSQDPVLLGQDVTDYYQLYTKPAEEDGKYYLAISEYEEDKSYLDQIKLLVIDHPLETFITIDDSGSVIQFAKPAFFADATLDSSDIYKLLYSLDSLKTEVSPSDTLSLSFEDVNAGTEQWLLLVGQVQAVAKAKVSGRIVSDTDNGKENSYSFTSFRLRRNPTYQWIVAPTSNTSSLQVDIVWQEEAEVDYAELSNRLELPFTLCEAELLFAVHSTNGDITTELVADDELVSELNQDEWIELVFSIPEKTVDMQRSFIFVTKGRYERLSQKLNKPSSQEEEVILPSETKLYSNYPNPFNPSTMISYSLRDEGMVSIKVYDILGSEVATLVNETKAAGTYEVEFNASQLPSGVYIYRMQAGSYMASKKMLLVK